MPLQPPKQVGGPADPLPQKLFIREGLSRIILISGHSRDLGGTDVVVYLFAHGQQHEIGRATGTSDGSPFGIPVEFTVPPNETYYMEVVEDGGDIVYPQDEREQLVEVINARHND